MARGARRDSKKEAFWRRMVRGQAGSGMSITAWCGQHGLSMPAFHWWRRELARRNAQEPKFVPVHIACASPPMPIEVQPDGQIEILLEGGRRICLHGRVDRSLLTDVLSVLEARPC